MPKGLVILHCPLLNLESIIFLECTLHKPDKDKTRIVLAFGEGLLVLVLSSWNASIA